MSCVWSLEAVLKEYTHAELCHRAVRWLYGTRRCNVALSGIASTREIPDAIGWSTGWRFPGSIVIECKTSLSDFHRDKRKKHPLRMGTRRFFFTPAGLVTVEAVKEHYPGHGLLYMEHGRVVVQCEAEVRYDVDLRSENRLLQFAIVHMRSNLLRMGMTVDFNLLTLHPFSHVRRENILREEAERARQEALQPEVARRFTRYCGPRTKEGCIPWTGPVFRPKGKVIAAMWLGGSCTTAARVAWAIHFGDVPLDMHVLRICINQVCVNWEHLTLEAAGPHEAFYQRGCLVGKTEQL